MADQFCRIVDTTICDGTLGSDKAQSILTTDASTSFVIRDLYKTDSCTCDNFKFTFKLVADGHDIHSGINTSSSGTQIIPPSTTVCIEDTSGNYPLEYAKVCVTPTSCTSGACTCFDKRVLCFCTVNGIPANTTICCGSKICTTLCCGFCNCDDFGVSQAHTAIYFDTECCVYAHVANFCCQQAAIYCFNSSQNCAYICFCQAAACSTASYGLGPGVFYKWQGACFYIYDFDQFGGPMSSSCGKCFCLTSNPSQGVGSWAVLSEVHPCCGGGCRVWAYWPGVACTNYIHIGCVDTCASFETGRRLPNQGPDIACARWNDLSASNKWCTQHSNNGMSRGIYYSKGLDTWVLVILPFSTTGSEQCTTSEDRFHFFNTSDCSLTATNLPKEFACSNQVSIHHCRVWSHKNLSCSFVSSSLEDVRTLGADAPVIKHYCYLSDLYNASNLQCFSCLYCSSQVTPKIKVQTSVTPSDYDINPTTKLTVYGIKST
jgi:hypothetical protein